MQISNSILLLCFVDFHTFSHIPDAKKFTSMLPFHQFRDVYYLNTCSQFRLIELWIFHSSPPSCISTKLTTIFWLPLIVPLTRLYCIKRQHYYYSTPCATSILIALSSSLGKTRKCMKNNCSKKEGFSRGSKSEYAWRRI